MHKCNVIPWERFWCYIILSEIDNKTKDRYFECKCDCWNIKNVRLSHLKYWSIKSCWKCPREQSIKKCICWKEMLLYFHERKKIYCSVECRINSTKKRYKYNCKVCGIEVEAPISRVNNNRECCSFSCRSILLQAKNHNMDVSEYKEIRIWLIEELRTKRKDSKYRNWRKECLKRDNNKCSECSEEAVCVHHIKQVKDYPELILEISNWKSLCQKCHDNIHYKQKKNVN